MVLSSVCVLSTGWGYFGRCLPSREYVVSPVFPVTSVPGCSVLCVLLPLAWFLLPSILLPDPHAQHLSLLYEYLYCVPYTRCIVYSACVIAYATIVSCYCVFAESA